jgi:2-oxoisovalerate dehydrogenase E2 component (dihydrolipoyl transacylase)
MTTFRLPDLGEGLQEAEIVAWHVSPGDHVVADQPLVSVETAKAVVEIPSPTAGRIARIYGKVGDMVPVGSPLVDYGDDDDTTGSQTVVGALPHEAEIKSKAPKLAAGLKVAPAIRRLARELSVDLATLQGSGPGGSIAEADVRKAAERDGNGEGEPLRGPRRSMAQAMVEAGREVVPATVTDDADVTRWLARDDPTVRLVAALVEACRAEPSLNAWYDGKNERRMLHHHVDVGIAMDTADGLFVPVLRRADTLAASDVRKAIDDLKDQVSRRRIAPADLTGQTITLSNFGTVAGRYASLVVIPPQVAILGAGRIEERIVAVNSTATVRAVLPLSLTFNHRAVTGGEAARFLGTVIASLESETGELK